MDIAPVLRKYSEIPFERLRIVSQLDELNLPVIRRGIIFIFAGWSGPAIIAFRRFTQVLAALDASRLDLIVLDIDCLSSEAGTALWGENVGGGGETLWVREGAVVARTLLCVPDTESEAHRNTLELLKYRTV